MNIRKISLTLFTTLLIGQVPPDSISWNESVTVDAHSGPGSILLAWNIPDTIKPDHIRVLRADDINGPFDLAYSGNDLEMSRYLDRFVVQEERYFYIIEILSQSGVWYSSDRTAPVFERIDAYDKVDPQKTGITLETVLPSDMVLIETIKYGLTTNQLSHGIVFTELLADSGELNIERFLQNVPLESIPVISQWLASIADTSFIAYLEKVNDSSAVYYRNNALLTPDEWNDEFNIATVKLQKQSLRLSEILNDALYYLDGLTPVFLSGLKNTGDSLVIQITDINLREDFALSVEIEQTEGFVQTLIYSGEKQFGQAIQYSIENLISDDSVRIAIQDDDFETFVVPPVGSALNLSLNGNILLTDDLTPLSYGPAGQMLSLNEIYVSNGSLILELFGSMTFEDRYLVLFNDSIIWNVETFYPVNKSFLDSSFAIDFNDSSVQVLHLARLMNNDSVQLIESYLLTGSTLAGKLPDGGKWTTLTSMSRGKTNATPGLRTAVPSVPELFALYQNYPNPFNGETRISFDLIQDSRVNLYVSDALGHVVDRFIIDEFMDKGTYNFTWEGGNHSSGIYFFTLSAEVNGFQPVVFSRKMIYMK